MKLGDRVYAVALMGGTRTSFIGTLVNATGLYQVAMDDGRVMSCDRHEVMAVDEIDHQCRKKTRQREVDPNYMLVAEWQDGTEDNESMTQYWLFRYGTDIKTIMDVVPMPDGSGRCNCTSCQNDWDCCGNWMVGAMAVSEIEIGNEKFRVVVQHAHRNV